MKPALTMSKPVFNVEKESSIESIERVDWTKQMDDYLSELAKQHKGRGWKSIAAKMQQRFNNPYITAKRCRERWACCLNPEISKASLSDAESVLLIIHHNTLNNRWSKMSKKIPHRYSSTLKNNFYSLIRSILRKMIMNEITKGTGLYLVQTIYVSWVAHLLMQRDDDYKPIKGDVPSHIRKLIFDKGLSESKCESYLTEIASKIKADNPDRNMIHLLDNCKSLKNYYDLFIKACPNLEKELNQIACKYLPEQQDCESKTVEKIVLDSLEEALNPKKVPEIDFSSPQLLPPPIPYTKNIPILNQLPALNAVTPSLRTQNGTIPCASPAIITPAFPVIFPARMPALAVVPQYNIGFGGAMSSSNAPYSIMQPVILENSSEIYKRNQQNPMNMYAQAVITPNNGVIHGNIYSLRPPPFNGPQFL